MSYTAVFLPIIAALSMAQDYITDNKLDFFFNPINNQQQLFIDQYYTSPQTVYKQLNKLKATELKTIVSNDSEVINKFFKDNKFDIKVEPFKYRDSFGFGSILKIKLKWLKEAKVTKIISNDKEYDAIEMTSGYQIINLENNKQVIQINTKNRDTVYITLAEKPLKDFELLDYVNALDNQMLYIPELQVKTYDYSSIVFPMVDYSYINKINWLIGMKIKDYRLDQAIGQTFFQMDEKGVVVKSGVGGSMEITCLPSYRPPLVIDKPFYIWIKRRGLKTPLFAGYIDYCNWNKPVRLAD